MTINTGFTLIDLEKFLMILMRITSFIYIAPFFSMANTPQRVKLGFSIFTAALIYMVVPLEVPSYQNLMEYSMIIIKESATGLLIGFSAYLCSTIIMFAGRMIDTEIGMSMATMFDQTLKTQSSLTGGLYNYLLLMMMLVTDMHHFLLKALVDTFQLIPIGGIRVEGLQTTLLEFISNYFMIGFRIVIPIFCVTLLVNVILGILAKVAPQMNMFAVGIQIKVLVGYAILFLLAGMLPSMANFIFSNMRDMVTEVIKGML